MAEPRVIYCDFKASNILLDEEFNAKLSEFGLAKVGPTGDKNHVSTSVMGTYGYCAPEYALTGQLTTTSDVYSFGVVRVIDNAGPSSEQNLVTWAQPLFRDRNKFMLMADPLLEGKYPLMGLYQALAIAAVSLQVEDSTQPSITDVVTVLEYLTIEKIDERTQEVADSPYSDRISCEEIREDIRPHTEGEQWYWQSSQTETCNSGKYYN